MDTKRCSKCGVEKALCEFNKNKNTKDGRVSQCKICDKERYKAYYEKNRLRVVESKCSWNKQNRTKINKTARARRRSNAELRIADNCRRTISATLKKQGSTKGGSTFSALPYSPQDLVEHLERQFDDKMSWDNYGSYWDVDHIYPQSLLPYDSLEHPNFQKCWALSNLQPLEKRANQRKSNKVLDD